MSLEHLKRLLYSNGYDFTDFIMCYENEVIDGDDATIQIEIVEEKEDYEADVEGILLEVFKVTDKAFQDYLNNRADKTENLYFLKNQLKEFEIYEIKTYRVEGNAVNDLRYALLYNMTAYDAQEVKRLLISEMEDFSELFDESEKVNVEVSDYELGDKLQTIIADVKIEAEKYEKN